jgi:putative hydrolase of the HAD superfamily
MAMHQIRLTALMVDVDGVLIRRLDGKRWDSDLLADLGVDPVDLDAVFFRPHFDDVLSGRADLTDRLEQVLPSIAAHVPAQDLIDYWFAHDASLDEVLLADLDQARRAGLAVHLATVQEHQRAVYLWNTLGLRRHFDGMHYAADLGARKFDSGFYTTIEYRTGFAPRQICLIDDRVENVAMAASAGWKAFHWSPSSRLDQVLTGVRPGTDHETTY